VVSINPERSARAEARAQRPRVMTYNCRHGGSHEGLPCAPCGCGVSSTSPTSSLTSGRASIPTRPAPASEPTSARPHYVRPPLAPNGLPWPLTRTRPLLSQIRFSLAVSGTTQIVRAASTGRVEHLFLLENGAVPGAVDGGADLLDTAAVQTLRHGGDVQTLLETSMPSGGPICAIFRYASEGS
jgi:hypothetical protein